MSVSGPLRGPFGLIVLVSVAETRHVVVVEEHLEEKEEGVCVWECVWVCVLGGVCGHMSILRHSAFFALSLYYKS